MIIAMFVLAFIPNFHVESFGNSRINPVYLVFTIVFIIAAFTDMLDGKIARKCNLVTDLGKFLDPLADKFLVDSAFILLCTRLDWGGHYQVLPIFAILFIGRDLAMDGLRSIAANQGNSAPRKALRKSSLHAVTGFYRPILADAKPENRKARDTAHGRNVRHIRNDMLFDGLFRRRPIQPEMRIFDRQILGHEPAVKLGTIVAHAEPAPCRRRFFFKVGGIL
jgi:CDP-diacylglycerol--glycerol-3-phosphate 3-phosphatidyltransferase